MVKGLVIGPQIIRLPTTVSDTSLSRWDFSLLLLLFAGETRAQHLLFARANGTSTCDNRCTQVAELSAPVPWLAVALHDPFYWNAREIRRGRNGRHPPPSSWAFVNKVNFTVKPWCKNLNCLYFLKKERKPVFMIYIDLQFFKLDESTIKEKIIETLLSNAKKVKFT